MDHGDEVVAKTGRHKGKKGTVMRNFGRHTVMHVYFPGSGLSFQPEFNLDRDQDGDNDRPGSTNDPDNDPQQ